MPFTPVRRYQRPAEYDSPATEGGESGPGLCEHCGGSGYAMGGEVKPDEDDVLEANKKQKKRPLP